VNGRGDVAVMWQSRKPARLRVTLLPLRGKAVTRVIAARPGDGGSSVTLACTRRMARCAGAGQRRG
jgi:hypothetical protein